MMRFATYLCHTILLKSTLLNSVTLMLKDCRYYNLKNMINIKDTNLD